MGFSTVGVIFWLDSTSGNQDSEVAGKKWRSEQSARGEPEKIVDAPRSFDKNTGFLTGPSSAVVLTYPNNRALRFDITH
jgi:hypothetical protein